MAVVHKTPIGLSIQELVAVDTWLFFREGLEPPEFSEIQAAYEKFIPAGEGRGPEGEDQRFDPDQIAYHSDTPVDMIQRMGCAACHRIPGIDFARTGVIGPLLIEGTNASRRIGSPEYQRAVKGGTARAKTPKEYVMESIMQPSAFIVPGFPTQAGGKSLMPDHFAQRFTISAAEKLAEFLLTLDEDRAIQEGLDRLSQEREGTLTSMNVSGE